MIDLVIAFLARLRLKLWQVASIGTLLIALGIVLHLAVDWPDPANRVVDLGDGWVRIRRVSASSRLMFELKWWLTFPVGAGLWFWYVALSVLKKQRAEHAEELVLQRAADAAELAARPVREEQIATMPTPPRLGDDPFREPPQVRIVVQQPLAAPSATPIVPGDPANQPKLLK